MCISIIWNRNEFCVLTWALSRKSLMMYIQSMKFLKSQISKMLLGQSTLDNGCPNLYNNLDNTTEHTQQSRFVWYIDIRSSMFTSIKHYYHIPNSYQGKLQNVVFWVSAFGLITSCILPLIPLLFLYRRWNLNCTRINCTAGSQLGCPL